MDKDAFIKDSRLSLLGVGNGIIGSLIYEIIISLFFSLIITSIVASGNPGATQEQLEGLVNEKFDSFPFSLIISILSYAVTIIVFIVILKWDRIKDILKKFINGKTLLYGFLTALCIMFFSAFYNSIIISVFDLDGNGNANQEGVIEMIKSGPLLAFLSVVILAPFVEELTYRYCLFGGLKSKSKLLAYLVSAFVFMFMHSLSSFLTIGEFNKELLMEMLYLPPYLFSGLALCFVYDKTENLGSSFIGHMLNNLVAFLGVILV